MNDDVALPLAGRGVVITRPQAQAGRLAQRLAAIGARTLVFPVIDIAPLDDITPLQALRARLVEFDYAFFVSANAVEHALVAMPKACWPAGLQVVTVGPGSAQALRAAGFAEVLLPAERFDSEGVLALPIFQPDRIRGRRVLVLRGDGGRELLAETLRERGAEVEQVSCYRRRCAATDPAPLTTALAAGALHALSLTSGEGAANFVAILGARAADALARLPVFVPHPRIAERVRALGAAQVIETAAGDDGLVAALVAFFAPDAAR